MSKKTLLMVVGLSLLGASLILGCPAKKTPDKKPDPPPGNANIAKPDPGTAPGMRPDPARPVPKAGTVALKVELTGEKSYVAGKPVVIRYKLTNGSKGDVRVLGWDTPLALAGGQLTAAIFKIERNGNAVSYIGAKAKRGDPDAKDYVTLGAGKAIEKPVDLAKSYDLKKPGTYTVTLVWPLADVVADAKIKLPRGRAQQQKAKLPPAQLSFTVTKK